MIKPLPIAFIILITGITFARYISLSLIIIALSVLFFCLASLFLKNVRIPISYLMLVFGVFITGALAYLNFTYLGPCHISKLLNNNKPYYYIKGRIISSPDYSWPSPYKRKASFFIKALSYKNNNSWIRLCGVSALTIRDNEVDYNCNDTFIFRGAIISPREPAHPGDFNYREFLKTKNIYTVVNVNSDIDTELIKSRNIFSVTSRVLDLRREIELFIRHSLRYPDSALLNAMLIGKRSFVPANLKNNFVKTGTAHILSISGLHIAALAGMLFFILRRLTTKRVLAGAIIIILLGLFVLLAGARTPVVRAYIMVAVYIFARMLERDFDIYSALSLSGIIILLASPMQLFDAGFILSFSCVFWICYLTPKLERYFKPAFKNKLLSNILKAGLASASVCVGIAPLTAYYFNTVSPISILANMLIVPSLGAILFIGVFFVVMSWICTPPALILAAVLRILFLFIENISAMFSKIPFSYFHVSKPPVSFIVGYYALLLIIINRERISRIFKKALIIILISYGFVL